MSGVRGRTREVDSGRLKGEGMLWKVESVESREDGVFIEASCEIGPGIGKTATVQVPHVILDMLVHLGTHVVSLEDRGILPPGKEGA